MEVLDPAIGLAEPDHRLDQQSRVEYRAQAGTNFRFS